MYRFARGIPACLTLSSSANVLPQCLKYWTKCTLESSDFSTKEKVDMLQEALGEWPLCAVHKIHPHPRSGIIRALKTSRIYYTFHEGAKAEAEIKRSFEVSSETRSIFQLTYALQDIRSLEDEVQRRNDCGDVISNDLLETYNISGDLDKSVKEERYAGEGNRNK
jgi:hypothetical protein